uniref:(northern house mosquito) hypothetical protein n=1 Tax=Culex pipiens TaxID=7175 RepID=A0A8D8AQZ4_CULPI
MCPKTILWRLRPQKGSGKRRAANDLGKRSPWRHRNYDGRKSEVFLEVIVSTGQLFYIFNQLSDFLPESIVRWNDFERETFNFFLEQIVRKICKNVYFESLRIKYSNV